MDYFLNNNKQRDFINFPLWESIKKVFYPPQTTNVLVGEQLKTDIHAHWLPGVDDGARTVEEGLEIVEALMQLGYKKLIATPHIKQVYYENEPDQLYRVFRDFEAAVAEKGWEVELSLAAEYMLDEGFQRHLEEGLLTLSGNMVLIEMSFFQAYQGLEKLLFDIQLKGYQPVLAHPERYQYYFKKWEQFEMLKERGCLFQLNIPSLTGYYGKEIANVAHRILAQGWYEFAGTDLHHRRQLKSIQGFKGFGMFQNAGLN